MIEDILAEEISHPTENLKYSAIDLLTESYDPKAIADKIIKKGAVQKLKYLATVTFEAAKLMGVDASRIQQILAYLPPIPKDAPWVHLASYAPDFGKRIIESYPKSPLELECKVHSPLTATEVADWIDLYITHNYVTSPTGQKVIQD